MKYISDCGALVFLVYHPALRAVFPWLPCSPTGGIKQPFQYIILLISGFNRPLSSLPHAVLRLYQPWLRKTA